jgi:hypothetical protein
MGNTQPCHAEEDAHRQIFCGTVVRGWPSCPGFLSLSPNQTLSGFDVCLTQIVIESSGHKTDKPRFVKRAQRKLRRKQKSPRQRERIEELK